MASERLGPARCPLCGGVASLGLSKSQLPVLTMNCCQAQLFARSDKSDMLARALLIKDPAPAPEPAPVPVTRHEIPPTPAPAPAPSPEPEPARGIGIFKW